MVTYSSSLQIATRTTMVSSTAEAIREAIYSGVLEQGDRIPQVKFCKALGVSRGTLRESLRELQEQGIITVMPHRGAFVTRFSAPDISDLYSLRALLEAYAIRKSMENSQGKLLAPVLEQLVREMDLSEKARDLRATVAADISFHRLLCERARNALLLQVFDSLSVRTRLCMLNGLLHTDGALPQAADHEDIVTAIRQGDVPGAESAVREHSLRAMRMALERNGYAD